MSREKGHGMPCPYEPNGLQISDAARGRWSEAPTEPFQRGDDTLKDRFAPVFQGVLHFVKELVGNGAVYYAVVVA